MLRYVGRRLVGWVVMIVIATNFTYFLATAFLDPASNYRERRPQPSPERIADALAPYNLDPRVTVVHRWWTWFSDVVVNFDWGRSPVGGSVNSEIGYRILVSAELVLAGTVLSVLIGVTLGVFTATRQYRASDRIAQTVSLVLFNLPVVVLALFLVFAAVKFNDLVGHRVLFVSDSSSPDVSGFLPSLWDRIAHLILPTLSLTLLGYVGYHLQQRTLLLEVLNADFVRTARATGLTKAQAVRRHALRSSLIPTATSVAFSIPGIFTGAVLTESIFGWHGMGEYFSLALSRNDVHGTVAVAAFGALTTAVGAILADICAVALDPRIRVGAR